jgi:hypothetical protein
MAVHYMRTATFIAIENAHYLSAATFARAYRAVGEAKPTARAHGGGDCDDNVEEMKILMIMSTLTTMTLKLISSPACPMLQILFEIGGRAHRETGSYKIVPLSQIMRVWGCEFDEYRCSLRSEERKIFIQLFRNCIIRTVIVA